MRISVAIDGPAGAGKSTIATLVAKKFDLMYINTGAMYRTVALKCKDNNISINETNKICTLIDNMEMKFENDDLILNGENIQSKLTMPEISAVVSSFASIKEVRERLVKLQRDMSNKFNVIMDGRDIGTVVLKDSKYKFFLTATPEERADRRFKELDERGIDVNYDDILKDIIRRDYEDSNRAIDPLRKAEDAIEIDTTGLNIQEVTDKICSYIKKNLK
ncbi:(d)CMP kinase [Clostridium gasigenes]|uniref:Cytidylate kinase n=1 Tax=Clostridium gasigenes TaxID=94869 RepID=A0A1H0NBL3_9CLOT|nr:(d)CMP kinase [Clostridium gasigenes]SDO90139.1 cytidylate kinase [Clostridium gasigenes]